MTVDQETTNLLLGYEPGVDVFNAYMTKTVEGWQSIVSVDHIVPRMKDEKVANAINELYALAWSAREEVLKGKIVDDLPPKEKKLWKRAVEVLKHIINIRQKVAPTEEATPDEEPEPIPEDKKEQDEIHTEAMAILKTGDPMEFIRESVNLIHIGDEQSIRMLISTQACQAVVNSRGEHPGVNGESGKGKTSVCRAVAHHLPQEMLLDTSVTPKALYYAGITRCTTLLIDDMDIPEELKPLLKRATSDWSIETYHTTVIKQEGVRLKIPTYVCWWFTSVDTDDDEQVLNRQLPLEVDDSADMDNKVWLHQLELMRTGSSAHPESRRVLVCREMLRIIKSEPIVVVSPFVDDKNVIWNNKQNRRNFDVFGDVLKSYTSLFRYQRKDEVVDGIRVVTAVVDDFVMAARLYCTRAESQAMKLSGMEMKVVRYLQGRATANKGVLGVATIDDIQSYLGKSYGRTHEILHGRKGDERGGLLKKLPALQFGKQTITDELPDETKRSRPKNLYTLDTRKLPALESYQNTVMLSPSFVESLDIETRKRLQL